MLLLQAGLCKSELSDHDINGMPQVEKSREVICSVYITTSGFIFLEYVVLHI